MFDVIVPIYRISKQFLERCLESIDDQTLTDYTVYVCDGTPPEHEEYDAQAMVESYGFNYLRQDPNRKLVGGARNQAVAEGSNPFIAFLDGDDQWYDSYLTELKTEIESSTDKTAIWASVLDTQIQVTSQFSGEPFYIKGLYGYWPNDLLYLEDHPDYAYYYFFGHPPAPTGTIIRREAFEAVGGYDETMAMCEDTELLLRIVGDPRKVPVEERRHYRVLDFIVGYHYVGEESTCEGGKQSGASGVTADIKGFFVKNMEYFNENHPKPTREDLPEPLPPNFFETMNGVMRNSQLIADHLGSPNI